MEFTDVSTNMEFAYNQAVSYSGLIGMFLGSTFLAIKVRLEYFKYSMGALQGNDARTLLDWNEIVRIIFLMIIIMNFKTVGTGFLTAIRGINSYTQKGGENYESVKKKWKDAYEAKVVAIVETKFSELDKAAKNIEGDSNLSSEAKKKKLDIIAYKKKKYLDQANKDGNTVSENSDKGVDMEDIQKAREEASVFNISSAISGAFMGLTLTIAFISKLIIGGFAVTIFYLGLLYGPIALAFGILNKQLPINYVGMLLNWGLVFTTLNLLDLLLNAYLMVNFVNPDKSESLAFMLTMIAAYFSAFKITQWFMGFSGMNTIMNKGVAVAGAMVATAAAAVVGGAALAGGAGGAGSTGATGSAGKSARVGGAVNKGANSSRVD